MPGEFLRVTGGNAAGTQIPVGSELLIGRAATGAGTLGDDPEISRNHARISYGPGGQLQVEDLGSTNGTYVNSRRIGAATPLKPGDTVQMGKSTLQVLDASGRAPQATAFGAGPPAAAPVPPPPPAAAPPPPPAAAPPPPPAAAPVGYGGPQAPPTAPLGAPVAGGPGGPVGQPTGGGGGNKTLIGVLAAVVGVLILVGILFAAGVIGGSDDGGSDAQKDIEATLASYLEDNDCNTLTESYLSELFNQSGSNAKAACRQAVASAQGLNKSDYTVTNVSVSGDSATADVEADEGSKATYKFAKEDGEWKIDSIRGEVGGAMASTANTTATQETTVEDTTATEDATTEMTDPRQLEAVATLEALIKAVKKSDELVFCGLLSPRQAQKLVGGPGGDAAIARCVTILKGRDFSGSLPRTLHVSGVKITGNQASVRLTNGERFTLVRRRGRYVVNSGIAS